MKEKTDLSRRDRTFTHFNETPVQAAYPSDGGYTLAFVSGAVPSLRSLSYDEKYALLTKKPCERGYVVKYRDSKNIFVGIYEKTLCRTGERFYTVKKWMNVVRFDGKRIIKNNGAYDIERFILEYFGLECIISEFSDRVVSYLLSKKTVLAGIFRQRITCGKDLVREWLKGSYHLTRIPSYKVAIAYLEKYACAFSVPSVADLQTFTTSLEKSMSLLSYERTGPLDFDSDERKRTLQEHGVLYEDLVKDAIALNIKVNPRWSHKRMVQEHQRTTEELMLRSDTVLSDRNYYGTAPEFQQGTLVCRVLASERELFREASEMHHCLYNNYRGRIERGTYLALSVVSPIRCTVGVYLQKPNFSDDERCAVYFDQVQQRHDLRVDDGTQDLLRHFVSDNSELFGDLMHKASESYAVTETNTVRYQQANVDLPF